MINDDIKEILIFIENKIYPKNSILFERWIIIKDYITKLQQELEEYKDTETYSKRFLYKANKDRLNANLDLVKENERLKREVAKLHIIQEEYGNHIENTHIIDDYQKTYFMTNKYLIELKNHKFVYVDELNDKYEDYKSRIEKAVEYIKEMDTQLEVYGDYDILSDNKNDLLNILNGRSDE